MSQDSPLGPHKTLILAGLRSAVPSPWKTTERAPCNTSIVAANMKQERSKSGIVVKQKIARRHSSCRLPNGSPPTRKSISNADLVAQRSLQIAKRQRKRRVLMFRYFTMWFISSLALLHLLSNVRLVWSWLTIQSNSETCVVNGTYYQLPPAPSIVIIGTQKAGTTALASFFHRHPKMVGSSRELHFFDFHYRELYQRSDQLPVREQRCWLKRTYLQRSNFPFSNKIAFEKSPSYMISPHIPEAVSNLLPHAFVVAVLRNPVDRLVSHFNMQVRLGRFPHMNGTLEAILNQELSLLHPERTWLSNVRDANAEDARFEIPPAPPLWSAEYNDFYHWDDLARTPSTFRSFDRLLQRGMYSVQLERWLDRVGPERLVVVPYELFQTHPREVLEHLFRVTGVPHWHAPDKLLHQQFQPVVLSGKRGAAAASTTAVDVPIDPAVREFLERFYRPYNDRLADLLGEEWRGIWDGTAPTSPEDWKQSWLGKLQ